MINQGTAGAFESRAVVGECNCIRDDRPALKPTGSRGLEVKARKLSQWETGVRTKKQPESEILSG